MKCLPTELAKEIFSAAEAYHVKFGISSTDRFGLAELLRRPFFLLAGAEGAFASALKWALAAGIGALVIFGLDIPWLGARGPEQWSTYQAFLIILTSMFLLTLPSRFAFMHTTSNAVRAVAEKCEYLRSASLDDLASCERICGFVEKACSRRISTLWFIPATSWGIALYLTQKALGSASPEVGLAAFVTLISALLAGGVGAYARSVWVVFGLTTAVIELQRQQLTSLRVEAHGLNAVSEAHPVKKRAAGTTGGILMMSAGANASASLVNPKTG